MSIFSITGSTSKGSGEKAVSAIADSDPGSATDDDSTRGNVLVLTTLGNDGILVESEYSTRSDSAAVLVVLESEVLAAALTLPVAVAVLR